MRVRNERVIRYARVTAAELAEVEAREEAELEGRCALYREGRPPMGLAGRAAVVVDDGMATGATARAACQVALARGAERVVLAVPVASPETASDLGRVVEVVCLETPRRMCAVGEWYRNFDQTSDEEVVRLLREARSRRS